MSPQTWSVWNSSQATLSDKAPGPKYDERQAAMKTKRGARRDKLKERTQPTPPRPEVNEVDTTDGSCAVRLRSGVEH